MKKILITGGAGFIGYHVAKRVLDDGHTVVIVDDFSRGIRDKTFEALLEHPRVSLLVLDLAEKESWEKVGEGYDYVYHLAAVNGTRRFYTMPHEILRSDTLMNINALEWFRTKNKDGKIIFTSSCEAYGGARESFNVLQIPTPENVPLVIPDVFNPRWSYAGAKIIGEQLFIHYANAYKFRMSIVRPHNFFGPREGYEHVIPEFILRSIDRKDPFPLHGEQEKRSYCYIDDAVDAMVRIMESEKTDGHIYHVGSQEEKKGINLALTICKLMGWEPKKFDGKPGLKGSVNRRLSSLHKIKNDIGWEPKTTIEEGLKKTIEWYVANPRLDE